MYGFSEDHIVERFEQKQAFPKTDPGKAHYEGVDLGQYLKDGKRGVFLLHLSGYDPVAEKKKAAAAAKAKARALEGTAQAPGGAPASDTSAAGDDSSDTADSADQGSSEADEGDESADGAADNAAMPTDTRLIVVTDLGMLVKRSLDGSQDVFVAVHPHRPTGGSGQRLRACRQRADALHAGHQRRWRGAFPHVQGAGSRKEAGHVRGQERRRSVLPADRRAPIASSITRASISAANRMR